MAIGRSSKARVAAAPPTQHPVVRVPSRVFPGVSVRSRRSSAANFLLPGHPSRHAHAGRPGGRQGALRRTCWLQIVAFLMPRALRRKCRRRPASPRHQTKEWKEGKGPRGPGQRGTCLGPHRTAASCLPGLEYVHVYSTEQCMGSRCMALCFRESRAGSFQGADVTASIDRCMMMKRAASGMSGFHFSRRAQPDLAFRDLFRSMRFCAEKSRPPAMLWKKVGAARGERGWRKYGPK